MIEMNPEDICSCGHRYSEHRILCTCGKRVANCGHAADEWDTACFHQDDGKYCRCGRFRQAADSHPPAVQETEDERQRK